MGVVVIELIFGTRNKSKIDQIQGALGPLGILVRGIDTLGVSLDVPETGETAIENARAKAAAYATAAGRTVFSMDNALYFEGLGPEEQPGVHVRRIPGSTGRISDQEVLEYYVALIRSHGSVMDGYWEFGICIATPAGLTAEKVIRAPRQFTATCSTSITADYSLEAIQLVDGKYLSEMSREEMGDHWRRAIGEPLMRFVSANMHLLVQT
jgi:hypothetical protein